MDSNNKYSQPWKKIFTKSETEKGHLIVHLASISTYRSECLHLTHLLSVIRAYESDHKGLAVLLPGFAITW